MTSTPQANDEPSPEAPFREHLPGRRKDAFQHLRLRGGGLCPPDLVSRDVTGPKYGHAVGAGASPKWLTKSYPPDIVMLADTEKPRVKRL